MSSPYIGSRWKSRDKREDRTVTVVSKAAAFRGEHHFLIRNERTGRETNISLSGLWKTYRQIDAVTTPSVMPSAGGVRRLVQRTPPATEAMFVTADNHAEVDTWVRSKASQYSNWQTREKPGVNGLLVSAEGVFPAATYAHDGQWLLFSAQMSFRSIPADRVAAEFRDVAPDQTADAGVTVGLGRVLADEADLANLVEHRTPVVLNDGTVCHVVDTNVAAHPRGFRLATGEMRIYNVDQWLPAHVIEVSL